MNVLLCLLTGIAVALLNRSADAIPWFPLGHGLRSYVPHDNVTYYLWWVFLVNYALLIFNMTLVFYPFDGGRMIQELLWVKIGYYRSMMIGTAIGMVGAVITTLVGISIFRTSSFGLTLILLASMGFITCYRQRQILREMGPEEWEDGPDYSAAYEQPRPARRRRRVSNRVIRKIRRRAQQMAEEKARVDAILIKVSAHGMASLNWRERRVLRKATEHQRKRDLELSRDGL